jgi:peptide/nickel transport system permease protein
MLLFILRRTLSGVVVLAVVAMLTFFLLYFSAQNVARNILGDAATMEQVRQKEVELGLDQPITTRFANWFGGVLQGDFGTSWFNSNSVLSSILDRLPATLSLVLVTIVVVTLLSTLVGVAAAVRRGWLDRGLQVLSIGGSAMPQFVVAILVVTVFAVQLRWFPATGYVSPNEGIGRWLGSIALPVAALAVTGVASTAQQVRSAVITELGKDYVRTLRSRGLTMREILFRHVLRGAAPAALTVLSLLFIELLGGIVVIEQIFALPGVGYLSLRSTTLGDMPVLMGVVFYVVLIVVIVNLLVDLAVGWLNPKARIS